MTSFLAVVEEGQFARAAARLFLSPAAVTGHVQALAGRGVGSALYSFARYYPWPGTVCVPVLDAPWQHSVLATRAADTNPLVLGFRRLASGIAEAANWLAPPADWASPAWSDARIPGC